METLRRLLLRPAAVGMLLLPLVVSRMPAQSDPSPPRGAWVAGGFGAGSAKLTCDDCIRGDPQAGPIGMLGLGYAFSHRAQVALEISGWTRPLTGSRTSVGYADAVVYLYPLSHTPFSLGVGVGFARYATRLSRGGEKAQNRLQGAGGKLVARYDLPLGAGIFLSPGVAYHRSFGGSLQFDGEKSSLTARSSLIELGAVLRWHWATPITGR